MKMQNTIKINIQQNTQTRTIISNTKCPFTQIIMQSFWWEKLTATQTAPALRRKPAIGKDPVEIGWKETWKTCL